MNEAKEKFFKSFDYLASQGNMTICENIIIYVTELEQQNEEFMKAIKKIEERAIKKSINAILRICFEILNKYKQE